VGSDPASDPRCSYLYDARKEIVNLTDASGAVAASYADDTWVALTRPSEAIPNSSGWSNPYRYDRRDGVWAYDQTLGRYLARDRLRRSQAVKVAPTTRPPSCQWWTRSGRYRQRRCETLLLSRRRL